MEKIKYYAYARKSSEDSTERQTLSIPSQKQEVKEKFGDLEIIELEESKSAHEPGRPIFNQMIEDIKAGKAQGIIAWHPDRLSRNPIDAGMLIYLLDHNVIKDIKFVSYNFTNDIDGKKHLNNTFSDTKYYSDKLGIDVKRGIKAKLSKGELPRCAPAGYGNTMLAVRGANKIIVDKDRFDLIRKLWDLMLTGKYAVAEIQRIAENDYHIRTLQRNKNGGTPISKTGLFCIFRNPFYAGLIRHKGEYFKGTHEPMITIEEFDRVQIILGKRGQPRPKIHKFPYTGMMTCGFCGCAITAEITKKKLKDGSINIHSYYHCTHQKKNVDCRQKSMTPAEIEEYFHKALESFEIPDEFIEWGLHYLNELNDSEIENRSVMVETAQKEYNNVQQFMDRLTQLYCSSKINDEQFERQNSEFMRQKAILTAKLKDLDVRADGSQESAIEFFQFLKNAKYWFENGDEETKKLTVLQFASNLVVEDQKITIVADNLFSVIQKGLERIQTKLTTIEPDNSGSYTYKLPQFAPVKNLWQGYEGSNPD